MHYFYSIFHFFVANFPSLELISWLFPVAFLFAFLSLFIAGFCKQKLNWRTGFTRKIFHFLIFFGAMLCQLKFGLKGVFILGWSVSIMLVYAIIKGDGNIFFEALAREKDAPFRTKYIVYSYLATFFGGVFSNLFFGKFAVFGYAITGIADAIAEPIGTFFGKHQYRVFSFDKQKISYRSLEGSVAVFIASFLICLLLLQFLPYSHSLFSILIIAISCTIVEAFSPSGFDNMLLQLVGSFLAMYFFAN